MGNIKKSEIIEQILPAKLNPQARGQAFAPANIALAKYWGKRDRELNLPTNGSLSLSLADLGTKTTVQAGSCDQVIFNANPLEPENPFSQKVFAFIDLFRRGKKEPLQIITDNNIPTAAGLASSASGFAALTLALNDYWQLQLPRETLSMIARFGSGSACRSLWHGFVKWERGEKADGTDSFAHPINTDWQNVRFAIVEISSAKKAISSGKGMNHTTATSPLFAAWQQTATNDLETIEQAIIEKNFSQLGKVAEGNALAMHATMLAARPGLSYFLPETLSVIQKIWTLRQEGLEIYCTIDAGANVKIILESANEHAVKEVFPQAWLINPFQDREKTRD